MGLSGRDNYAGKPQFEWTWNRKQWCFLFSVHETWDFRAANFYAFLHLKQMSCTQPAFRNQSFWSSGDCVVLAKSYLRHVSLFKITDSWSQRKALFSLRICCPNCRQCTSCILTDTSFFSPCNLTRKNLIMKGHACFYCIKHNRKTILLFYIINFSVGVTCSAQFCGWRVITLFIVWIIVAPNSASSWLHYASLH